MKARYLWSAVAVLMMLLIGSVVVSEASAITVDGKTADWEGIAPLATGKERLKELYAFADGERLYILIYATEFSTTYNNLFIDIDGPARGFQHWRFARSGAEYLVQNGALYKSNSAAWDWTSVGPVDQVIADDPETGLKVLEMAIDISGWEITDVIRMAVHIEEPDTFLPENPIGFADVPVLE